MAINKYSRCHNSETMQDSSRLHELSSTSTVVEALVEIVFKTDKEWDQYVIAKFWDVIKEEYPHRIPVPSLRAEIEIGVPLGGGVPDIPIFRFQSDNGNRSIQIGPEVVSAHILKNYRFWPALREMAELAIKRYQNACEDPDLIFKPTMRYVNRFAISELSMHSIEGTLKIRPLIPPLLGDKTKSLKDFISSTQVVADGGDVLTVMFSSSASGVATQSGLILDLSVGTQDYINREKSRGFFDRAHALIEEVFLASLTDVTKSALAKGE